MNSQPGSPHGTLPRIRLVTALWISGILLCVIWSGCSIEKYYGTLSIFFDGVPNPEAKARAQAAAGITEDLRNSPNFSQHRPFAEDACMECHAEVVQPTIRDSALCMKCHEDRTTQYPRMHGPVAAVACLWCHLPHESAEAHLLRKPAAKLCAQCHEPALLSAERVPAHADPARSCLDCHSGHGGEAQYFLHEPTAPGAPSAPPAAPAVPVAPIPSTEPPPEPAPK